MRMTGFAVWLLDALDCERASLGGDGEHVLDAALARGAYEVSHLLPLL